MPRFFCFRGIMKIKIVLFFLLLTLLPLTGEDGTYFSFYPGDRFILTERQDIRMRENGRYKGFIYRELRISMDEADRSPLGTVYQGTAYLFQEMKKDSFLLGRRVEESGDSSITLAPNGQYQVPHDQILPLLRSVPSFPDEPLVPGDSWRVFGERMVRAVDGAPYTRVPLYIEYRYQGEKGGEENPYHSITAQYAIRYREGDDSNGDRNLSRATGSHKLEIRVPVYEPENIFMRDIVEEQYMMRDGTNYTYSGVILTWFDSPVDYDKRSVIERITEEVKEKLEDEEEDVILVTEVEEGLMLSLPNIHFVPDSAEILSNERARLDILADALAEIEGVQFLIRGHTADVGSRESQIELSYERAKTILDELASRGIPVGRMMYEGKGGDFPIAPNNTEDGRSQNRRVEIIILE